MRDEGPRNAENARVAFERAVGQFGELAIEIWGKVVMNFPHLLFNDVKVVEQPFGGGRDGAPCGHRARDAAVRLDEDFGIVFDPGEKPAPSGRLKRDPLGRREALGMLLQAFDAEEFGPDRVFRIPEGAPERPCDQALQPFDDPHCYSVP